MHLWYHRRDIEHLRAHVNSRRLIGDIRRRSMAGVVLAELLVAVCAHAHGYALPGIARRRCGKLGRAAAALACAA